MKIGLAGFGTVGRGVAEILATEAPLLAARAGQPLELTAISCRTPSKCPQGIKFVPGPIDLINEADVVVEVIGGAEGIARELIEASLAANKPVVTANKALMAKHGLNLATYRSELRYEAAVAGGIPIIRALREGLAGCHIKSVMGIINGSTNYMLTEMAKGRSYADVEAEAKIKGFLEADPSLDVDGHDAAQKLTLLAALAFGWQPDESKVQRTGIRGLKNAQGVKLIAYANEQGLLVTPMCIPNAHPLASVHGPNNLVLVETANAGTFSFGGPGAGSLPTAAAIVADLVDIARGNRQSVFGQSPEKLIPAPIWQGHPPFPLAS